MVTRLAWMAARLVSSKRETRYASEASWSAMTAEDWKRRSVCEGTVSLGHRHRRTKKTNLEVLSDFSDKTLEGELADEELRRLLVPTNLTESDGTRPETMRLLDTTSCSLQTSGVSTGWARDVVGTYGGSLASLRLRSELLARCLT